MPVGESSGHAPLSTSRPWLSVAGWLGCLGGGAAATALVVAVALLATALFVFFPDAIPGFGASRREQATFLVALGKLHESPALRVATREVDVRVDASIPTEVKLRAWLVPIGPGWTVEVGRTKAEIVAPGNRVQYIVPMRDERGAPIEIPWRAVGDGELDRMYEATFPPPRVDEELVEVQSDPKRLRVEIDRDWVDHVVGDDSARDAALAAIRAAVVAEAGSSTAIFEVREKARAVVAEMIRAQLPEDARDLPIRIRWSDEPVSAGAPLR
jgi:hypothetical protein